MRRKEQAKVEPRSCQETNKKTRQNQEETERRQNQGKKEGNQPKTHLNKTKGTVGKQAGSPCLTLWWKVLMLNQKLIRDCLEFLLGKPSASVQMN